MATSSPPLMRRKARRGGPVEERDLELVGGEHRLGSGEHRGAETDRGGGVHSVLNRVHASAISSAWPPSTVLPSSSMTVPS